ncbi:MAG: zinc ribbon domain-containing protein [Thermoguttaceae bacterium]
MPIYEFYCANCHTIYNFFSRKIDTTTRPSCPGCSRPRLERRVSRFAISRKRADKSGPEGDLPGLDDPKIEQALESLMQESEGLDENDPRQLARMMRKLHQTAGMPLDGQTEEAIRRMESGESPEKIEEELGDIFGEDGPAPEEPAGRLRRLMRKRPPKVDKTLYDL